MIDIYLRSFSLAKISVNRVEKPIFNECVCRNGGTCYSSSASGKLCQCPSGFTGPFCETTICKLREFKSSIALIFLANRMNSGQQRCSQSACQNGATCQEQGSDALCICKPGFTGQRCENGSSSI